MIPKNRKEEDRNTTPIPTRWNNKEMQELNDLMKLLGESKISTAIKKGVVIAKNVLHNTFGDQVEIKITRIKK